MQTVGDYLREKRMDRGWTLQKLADKIGCRRQYIHAIEKGEVAPSKEKLRALAAALGSDGLILRLLGGDIPKEIIDVLIREPELAQFIMDNAHHPNLSPLSPYLHKTRQLIT